MRERRIGALKIHSGTAFTAGVAFADLAADAEKGVVLNEASQPPYRNVGSFDGSEHSRAGALRRSRQLVLSRGGPPISLHQSQLARRRGNLLLLRRRILKHVQG